MNRRHVRLAAALGLSTVLVLGVAACGDDEASTPSGTGDTPAATGGAGTKVSLSSKGFPESDIVTEAYAQALTAAGFETSVKSLASTQIADAAIRKGSIDLYPEYDGTAYGTVLKQTKVIKNKDRVFQIVIDGYAKRGLTALPPAPFNNGNEVACTTEAIDANGITNYATLAKAAPKLVYAANAEHLTRADGLPVLQKTYGIKFKSVKTVDITLRYKPIESGDADCVYAFGTDPQLGKLPVKVIPDEKGVFSGGIPFRTFPVVNTTWLDGLSPEAKTAFTDTLAKVNAALTADAIRPLIAQVALDKEDPADVAETFLADAGLN